MPSGLRQIDRFRISNSIQQRRRPCPTAGRGPVPQLGQIASGWTRATTRPCTPQWMPASRNRHKKVPRRLPQWPPALQLPLGLCPAVYIQCGATCVGTGSSGRAHRPFSLLMLGEVSTQSTQTNFLLLQPSLGVTHQLGQSYPIRCSLQAPLKHRSGNNSEDIPGLHGARPKGTSPMIAAVPSLILDGNAIKGGAADKTKIEEQAHRKMMMHGGSTDPGGPPALPCHLGNMAAASDARSDLACRLPRSSHIISQWNSVLSVASFHIWLQCCILDNTYLAVSASVISFQTAMVIGGVTLFTSDAITHTCDYVPPVGCMMPYIERHRANAMFVAADIAIAGGMAAPPPSVSEGAGYK